MIEIPTYFVYTDPKTNSFCYYDADSRETFYAKPKRGVFIDPDTGQDFHFPGTRCRRRHSSHDQNYNPQPPLCPPTSDAADACRIGERQKSCSETVRILIARPIAFVPDPESLALPDDLRAEINRFRLDDYAADFFADRRCKRIFARKQVRLSQDQAFQTEPIQAPLLAILPGSAQAKQAVKAFQCILTYTAPGGCALPSAKGGLAAVRRLLKIATDWPNLRDEIFFQLIKQTRKNPDQPCAIRTWELFLIFATFVPSTRNSENDIKSHLVHCARSKTKRISLFAQFIFIRYTSRSLIGKLADNCANISQELVVRIARDPFEGRSRFGTSIAEQLWHQRLAIPNCPVPLLLVRLVNLLIHKEAGRAEGIFRISGRERVVAEAVEAINAGGDVEAVLEHATVHDVAHITKQWFLTLPGKLISPERNGLLRNVVEKTKDYIGFIESFSPPEVLTARYFIGFLQSLLKDEETTKMNVTNIAIIFGSAFLATAIGLDHKSVVKYTQFAQTEVSELLQTWDTSEIYPLPTECFMTEPIE